MGKEPDGGTLVTLPDAGNYIIGLPQHVHAAAFGGSDACQSSKRQLVFRTASAKMA
jgi:hypothetical protein